MQQNTYTEENSEYLKKNATWHTQDSEWKAKQIVKLVKNNKLEIKNVVEIGCGAGEILVQLQKMLNDSNINYEGYDISPDAYNLSKSKTNKTLHFFKEDFLMKEGIFFDLALIIDVFEHVDDYISFIKKCSDKATFKIYHIPLDLHISALLRNQLIEARKSVGHIHYFTKETALATLSDSGQEIVDYFYTPGALELPGNSLKTRVVNIFRKTLYALLPDFSVRLLGGYSLIVLTK